MFGVFVGGAGIGGAAVGRAPSLPGGAGTAFVGSGGRGDGSVIVALATRRPVGTTDTRGPAGVAVGFEVAVGVEVDVDVEASEPTDQPAENSPSVPSTENEDAVGTVISGDAVPVNRRRMDPTPPCPGAGGSADVDQPCGYSLCSYQRPFDASQSVGPRSLHDTPGMCPMILLSRG